MNANELWLNPICHPDELGRPIPPSVHAVSMALPRWQDVVGYEEKQPEVMNRLTAGYPRFFMHALIRQLGRDLGGGPPCLPFPSLRVAEQCLAFMRRHTAEPAYRVERRGLHGVATTPQGETALRAFWQHAGWIVSSRQAEAHLNGQPEDPDGPAIRQSLRRQLAGFYDCDETDVFLTPTGMAAQCAALQAALGRTPGKPTVQLGFPYVDTLKLQQKLGHGATLLHDLEHLEAGLRGVLGRQPLAAGFCEIPGNPLLGSADLRCITPILRERGVPLVADDVVATPFNVDLRSHADLIATSLTKFMAGTGDVMGGAVICNPRSPYAAELKGHLQRQHEELLWASDAAVLDTQARGCPERMRRHNANGRLLAERLRAHPSVERVWYPKWEFSEIYEAVRRPDGGWGSLITFLPRNARTAAPRIYDRLAICKGPSLGTVFTLACPFTLLAHYTELEWAESCGVSRHLIRLSVGLEDPEDLWRRLDTALRDAG
jgi:cystathionine gamma-synthase